MSVLRTRLRSVKPVEKQQNPTCLRLVRYNILYYISYNMQPIWVIFFTVKHLLILGHRIGTIHTYHYYCRHITKLFSWGIMIKLVIAEVKIKRTLWCLLNYQYSTDRPSNPEESKTVIISLIPLLLCRRPNSGSVTVSSQ